MKKSRTIEALIPLLVLVSCSGSENNFTLRSEWHSISENEAVGDTLTVSDNNLITYYNSYDTPTTTSIKTLKFNDARTTLTVEIKNTYVHDEIEGYSFVWLSQTHTDSESGQTFDYAYIQDSSYKTYTESETDSVTYSSANMNVNISEQKKTCKYPKLIENKRYLGNYSDYKKLAEKSQFDRETIYLDARSKGEEYYDLTACRLFPIVTYDNYEAEKTTGRLDYTARWRISYKKYRIAEEEISWKKVEVTL